MGGRYIISGVQIGEIKVLAKSKKVREIIEEVYEDQFLGDSKETIQLDLVRLSGIFNNKDKKNI